MRKSAFAPVVDSRTRLLILGSLPGDASLKATQYYAHPRNAFWRLVGQAIGRELQTLEYDARLIALREAGVGLWDVVASAHRPGSLDAAIRRAEAADLVGLIGALPRLQAIAFNGAKAAQLGRRVLAGRTEIRLFDLPSSSPAHARPFEEKAELWRQLGDVLHAD